MIVQNHSKKIDETLLATFKNVGSCLLVFTPQMKLVHLIWYSIFIWLVWSNNSKEFLIWIIFKCNVIEWYFLPEQGYDSQKVLNIANQKLKNEFRIYHSTIQVELYQETVMTNCSECQDLQD